METGRQDGGSDKNHAPFSVGKTGNISRKFLTIILKIFDKNFERLQLIFPVYFQAIGSAVKSSILTVVRTMVLFVPLGYLFSRFGLQYFWLTFPVTEVLTTLVGFKFYRSQQA